MVPACVFLSCFFFFVSFSFVFFLLKQVSACLVLGRSVVLVLSKLFSRHLSSCAWVAGAFAWCLVLVTLAVSSAHKNLLRGSFSSPVVLTFFICCCVLFLFPLYLPSKANLLAFYPPDTPVKVYVPFLTLESQLYLQCTCCQFKSPSFSHSDLGLCPLSYS